MRWPEDYPFPASVEGRARDFKCAANLCSMPINTHLFISRAAWFIANEIGVSSIPVSEVRPSPNPPSRCTRSLCASRAVLLPGARRDRRELRALRVLQGPRHPPPRGRAAPAPARVHRLNAGLLGPCVRHRWGSSHRSSGCRRDEHRCCGIFVVAYCSLQLVLVLVGSVSRLVREAGAHCAAARTRSRASMIRARNLPPGSQPVATSECCLAITK